MLGEAEAPIGVSVDIAVAAARVMTEEKEEPGVGIALAVSDNVPPTLTVALDVELPESESEELQEAIVEPKAGAEIVGFRLLLGLRERSPDVDDGEKEDAGSKVMLTEEDTVEPREI